MSGRLTIRPIIFFIIGSSHRVVHERCACSSTLSEVGTTAAWPAPARRGSELTVREGLSDSYGFLGAVRGIRAPLDDRGAISAVSRTPGRRVEGPSIGLGRRSGL